MSEIFGFLLGSRLGERRKRRRAQEDLQAGKVVSAIRLVAGMHDRLGRDWLDGPWQVEKGELALFSVRLRVDAVARDWRPPAFKETWAVDGDSRVFRLYCKNSVVEWAVPDDLAELAVSRLDVGYRD